MRRSGSKNSPKRPRILEMLTRFGRALIEALFPTKCLVCGSFFHPRCSGNETSSTFIYRGATGSQAIVSGHNKNFSFDMLMAPFLCPTCSSGFLPVESPICPKCGIMFKSREGEDHVCGECLKFPKRFRMARAAGVYDRILMSVIHCFKYKGKIQLARPLGILLFGAFISFWDRDSIDLIVPVPLHIKRFRQRGFNQAFLLIRDWPDIAEKFNLELPDIQIDREVLVRTRWTEPQTGLGRKRRIANIRNAIVLSNSARIADKRILLVDDVCTTGATADECAKVLLNGGARQVDVLTLARAM